MIYFTQGISKEGDIIDLGVKYGIIERSGAYFRYPSTSSGQADVQTLGQGREQTRQTLISDKKLAQELEKKIRKAAV